MLGGLGGSVAASYLAATYSVIRKIAGPDR